MVYDIPVPQQILVDQCLILDSRSSQYRDKGGNLRPNVFWANPVLSGPQLFPLYLGDGLQGPSCLCWLESEALSPKLCKQWLIFKILQAPKLLTSHAGQLPLPSWSHAGSWLSAPGQHPRQQQQRTDYRLVDSSPQAPRQSMKERGKYLPWWRGRPQQQGASRLQGDIWSGSGP